jgi:hypothetical protein
MRKEVILAIILGLILGAVIVAGYWRANSTKQKPAPDATVSPTPSVSSSQELLTLTAPQEGDIFNAPVATISGTTLPTARVVIAGPNDEVFVKPSANGYFSQEITLDGGANKIQVAAIDASGQRSDKIIHLVFTTELPSSAYESKP